MHAFASREGILHSILELAKSMGRKGGRGVMEAVIEQVSAPHTPHPFAIVSVTFPSSPDLRTSIPRIQRKETKGLSIAPRLERQDVCTYIFDIVDDGKVIRVGYRGQGTLAARCAVVIPTTVQGLRAPDAQAPALVDRLDAGIVRPAHGRVQQPRRRDGSGQQRGMIGEQRVGRHRRRWRLWGRAGARRHGTCRHRVARVNG